MRRIMTAVVSAACLAGVAGCGAGQIAATAEQRTTSPGAVGSVGDMQVRNAQFAWSEPVEGDEVYSLGADAPLQVTIVNDPIGLGPDRLVAVSSPIALTGSVVGDATIPDGQALVAGYDGAVSSIPFGSAREVTIVLEDLVAPVRAGLTYPVVFTFARAGDLVLAVGVENPDVLPPRARDGVEPEPELLGTEPGDVEVPG